MSEKQRSKEYNLDVSVVKIEKLIAEIYAYCIDYYREGVNASKGEIESLLEFRSYSSSESMPAPSQEDIVKSIIALKQLLVIVQSDKNGAHIHDSLVRAETLLNTISIAIGLQPELKSPALSRREVLKISGIIGAGALFLGIRAIDHERMSPSIVDESDGLSELEMDLRFIQDEYGLQIFSGVPLLDASNISGRRPSLEELAQCVKRTREWLRFYPKDFFREKGIAGFSFLYDLGQFGLEEKYSGVLSYSTRFIYYNAENFNTNHFEAISTFHHEIYHAADVGGNFFSNLKGKINSVWSIRKAQWHGVFNCNCDPYNKKYDGTGPFTEVYGQVNIEEDKATFADKLLSPDHHAALLYRISNISDPEEKSILENKIRLIKRDYFNWSNGKMDDQYWQDLLNGNVDEEYFERRSLSERSTPSI